MKNQGDKPVNCKGVLTDIIKWLTMTNQQQMLNEVEFSILDEISIKKDQPKNPIQKQKKQWRKQMQEQDDTESYQVNSKIMISDLANNQMKSMEHYDTTTQDHSSMVSSGSAAGGASAPQSQNMQRTLVSGDNRSLSIRMDSQASGQGLFSSGLESASGAEITKQGTGKALSSSVKKNRIVINDDIRSQMKKDSQKAKFTASKLNLGDGDDDTFEHDSD